MCVGIRLDIHPGRLSTNQGDVTGVWKDGILKGYNVYEYKYQPEDEPFDLSELSYNGVRMPGIVAHIVTVKSATTFFSSENWRLLLIGLDCAENYTYYANPLTKTEIGASTFTEFTVDIPLINDDLMRILKSIDKNEGMRIHKLYAENVNLAEKLLRSSDVLLDFSHKFEACEHKYPSVITNTNVTVEVSAEVGTRYLRARHFASGPFRVRGIKLPSGNYMKVIGGLPNDFIHEANMYYKQGDLGCRKPLLAELKKDENIKYILYKQKKHKWSIYKISKAQKRSYSIEKILERIEKDGKLDVSKLESNSAIGLPGLPKVNFVGGLKKVTGLVKNVTLGIAKGLSGKHKG